MRPAQCFCCCPAARKDELLSIAQSLYPQVPCDYTDSADQLRRDVIQFGDGRCAVLAGFSVSGVSDINLCAAVVADGCAQDVVLVTDCVSGSLRSRATSAGITRVYEADAKPSLPAREAQQHNQGLGMPSSSTVREGTDAKAPMVVLCSGRGGTGKTSIISVAASIAASWGMRVALVDLDLSNGNLYTCFGLGRGSDLAQLGAPGKEDIGALSVPVCDSVDLWGPCGLPEMAESVSPRTGELLSFAGSHADLVLVDTSSTTTDAVAEALQRADRVVIVYDGRHASLASLARMGSLAVRLGVARTRIMRLENHADPYEKPDFSLGRAEVGLEVARPLRVFEGGAEASQLLEEGLAQELSNYECDFTRSIASCLAQILEELGSLPACEEARKALREPSVKRRFWRFGHSREAS